MSLRTPIHRRDWLRSAIALSGGVIGCGQFARPNAAESAESAEPRGRLVGDPVGELVAAEVFASGGNAIDAVVAAAFAVAVTAPHQTGLGGYGLAAILGVEGGGRVVAIDANTMSPAGLAADFYQSAAGAEVFDEEQPASWPNATGWRTTGVPGVPAGLRLVFEQGATRSWNELLQPAVRFARDGFKVSKGLASAAASRRAAFLRDEASTAIYLNDAQPLKEGATWKNPELGETLAQLAAANSVESFYRGEIAQRIAAAAERGGGLLTTDDLAAYQAKVVAPLELQLESSTILTPPPGAGGVTALQTLQTLRAMDWARMPNGLSRTHVRIEATRWAWRDRLARVADSDAAKATVERLLSLDYARECSRAIATAVRLGRVLAPPASSARPQTGTIHLSAVDSEGNCAAVTLTHGNAFGACVTVPGLGLTLGHGLTRFEPRADHPNSPGPRKRPLHNMTPTLVRRDGRIVMAVGGAGGRRIPNGVLDVLVNYCLLDATVANSVAAPRLHTEGGVAVSLEKNWSAEEATRLKELGYEISSGAGASIGAAGREGEKLVAVRR